MNSIALIVAGATCLALSVFGMHKLAPREGKPQSAWLKTDGRATAASLSVFILLIGGAAMLLKGVLG